MIKRSIYKACSGWDGRRCLVHARCTKTPDGLIATAQYLDVEGSDLFSGILSAQSTDGGVTWTKFGKESGLAPIVDGELVTVGCDATPIYHKKSGDVLLLGQTAEYKAGGKSPTGKNRTTFYSVYDKERGCFSKMQLLRMPSGYENCGNGSGESVETENGDLLIPVYYKDPSAPLFYSAVIRCKYENGRLELLEIGNGLTVPVERGLYEPSIVCHKGVYYMTMRNDECGFVARSDDGLHYTHLQHWKWQDGSIVDNYNTQQHWLTLGDELYLVYTRRDADNNHVFRHRAPLFAARVEKMRLVRDSEIVVVDQRGARLGNFGTVKLSDNRSAVMAAEWMQPKGCEAYGSDNTVFFSVLDAMENKGE